MGGDGGLPKAEHIDIADDGTIVATTISEEMYIKDDINSKWVNLLVHKCKFQHRALIE